jgi:pimeloyl-ACP methyl ester carboxylesterase
MADERHRLAGNSASAGDAGDLHGNGAAAPAIEEPANLVILPGLDGTDVFFRPFMALLPPAIHPLVVCYPQSGANGYRDLLRVVRERISGLSDCFVLGSSFSGPLAIMLAEAEPARVRGIILSATFVRPPRRHLPRFKFLVVGPVMWAVRVIRRIPVWTLRKHDDPFRTAKAETWRRVSARCLAARVRAVLDVDVRETLRKCDQPVLCITFENDTVVPRQSVEEIVAIQPAARAITVPGDHLAMCKDPGPWTDAIVRFILAETPTVDRKG